MFDWGLTTPNFSHILIKDIKRALLKWTEPTTERCFLKVAALQVCTKSLKMVVQGFIFVSFKI